MGRRWLLFLLGLSAALVFAQLSTANSGLQINESATRFLVQDQIVVVLEVHSPANQTLPVHLKLELLDPQDTTRGLAVRDLVLQPGTNKLSIPLPLTARSLVEDDDNELPWYRLRYRIDPSTKTAAVPDAADGVISLSQIDAPDIFALEVSAPREMQRGTRYYTHIRALHPINGGPVKDVSVSVELQLDDNPKGGTVRGSGVTDANGYALVGLNIPARLSVDEGELKVVARHGGYVKETSDEVELNDDAQIMITTDKPIYQPGQPLHVRALVFNSAKRAAGNIAATLKITDPEDTTVFQTSLLTSRFGVANADWQIPENTRLGDYTIAIELDDETYSDANGYQSVKISRYDLPNFTVSVKPDRTYYLPQQNAEIEVRAEYLFGQPVKRGHVRVIREEEREWNFRDQKWETKASDTHEGETDENGRFLLRLDLKQDHAELAERDYSRFTDLPYAAYFTDPTTNRTEQRRFDLRITRDAIHIYVAASHDRQTRGFPLQFFVATSYADGTPASCDVAISEPADDDKFKPPSRVLETIRTNKYGVAKVAGLIPLRSDGPNYWYPSLNFTARNDRGSSGHHTESFYYRDVPVVRVETDKALYRPGEPIKVNISASKPDLELIVDVSRESNLVESRSVTLHGGAATLTLSNRAEFQDEVTISAYARTGEYSDSYQFPFGSRTVLFPGDRDLKLNFRFDHADYKPGEDATVDFRILTPNGQPATSALGVVIFDRAVEERARTDQDFSGRFGFYGSFSQWRGYDDQVGGITRRDLQRINLAKPLPEGIDLVAELLLGSGSAPPAFFSASDFQKDHKQAFSALIGLQTKSVGELLETRYRNGGVYPANGETLRRLLFESNINFDQLTDPWGTPYRDVFSIEKDYSVLEVISAGPDKIFATKDDFSIKRFTRPYFIFTGEAISRAVERFHARTGGFIRDTATLKTELQSEGIDFDSLRDPWGQPYNVSFTTTRDRFNLIVRSSGPNKRFEKQGPKSDDFMLWMASLDYLIETRVRIEQVLSEYFRATNTLPGNDSQLQQTFAGSAIDQESLRDPWGHRYYAVYQTAYRYADRASIQSVATYGQPAKPHTEMTPVTQQIASIRLRSGGEDGKEGTVDDFDVAYFSRLTAEQSIRDQAKLQPFKQVFFPGAKGAIEGTVTDSNGAVIVGVKVKGSLAISLQEFETETADSGKFILQNLPVGSYTVRCDVAYFKSAIVTGVPVSSSNITTVNFTLEPGSVSEVVTVTAGVSASVESTSSQVSLNVSQIPRVSVKQTLQLTTPRLREYFPETLVWQPALETDQEGRAQLKFKLADNITTWKMSVIGSTEDGEIGMAETEIKSFQPFFVEHDPPRVLTEGDQISLPVVLRNYLERAQTVDLEMKPEGWFTLLGPARQRANVAAGDSARQTFELKAVASVKDGKQRVTASGAEASDAIEKPVTVHPDGEEKTQTTSDIFSDVANLNVNLPASVIPGSTQAEVKVYPNLMGHVTESVTGILERPYGCGEQTISSTYPSLLLLRRNKQLATDSRIRNKAERYAVLGYQRLLNYRAEDGGFTYWGRGDADIALTAYALRFLHDAAEFVSVDDEVIRNARQWLIKQQRPDGSWPASSYNSGSVEQQRRTALVTAFVARVLALTERRIKIDGAATTKPETAEPATAGVVSPELKRALGYLATRVEEIDEPYLIASYALAAINAGDGAGAARATAKLRLLVRAEADTSYWELETNTPFYGWGLAGKVETTALAIQALSLQGKTQSLQTATGPSTDPLVTRGLLFLLRAKDRYGVWHSTQATINVLDALITLLGADATLRQTAGNGAQVEVVVNGQPATSLQLSEDDQTASLIRADVSRFLQSGVNRIELRRVAGSAFATVQMVANYYVPWSETAGMQSSARDAGAASSLRLATTFDKSSAKINEEISCHVKAERIGSLGYGMMLAEIGLPPGADVDRASLESAMTKSGWAFSQYDVLPDRVVVYLWAKAGGIDFDFKFRPRFALTAKNAPSVVYDYYNPEARAVVAPATFVIK